MKSLLIGINAKYIHPNLAIRLLKANTNYPCDFIEFNIKDEIDKIIANFASYDILAFSCYIWNIEIIKKILNYLKENKNNKIIILGGPEVSYNAKYYLENNLANFVIKNEGEEAFDKLLAHFNENKYQLIEIPNLYYEDKFTFDKQVDLNKTNMAYHLLDDLKNRIIYIETSRGCPFHCGYCMASLDNNVRFFSINKIKEELLKLINNGGHIFKFLDRTFNANKANFISLIDFIILNHKENNSFQFEITGDLLDEDVIYYINTHAPKNLFRFEIGIQSTNILANKAVGRIQNNEKLFKNIRIIQDANIIDLHLDLIAGLPYEDYNSFINTFNEVLTLRPKELQLGFLKLLHGTKLKEEANKYNYRYLSCAPYEIIENKFMSSNDIANIHITEEAFEKYYNSSYYKKTINLILDNLTNPYLFFYDLGLKLKESNIKNLEDSFKLLDEYSAKIFNEKLYFIIHNSLIIEYLSYFKVKPKVWWTERPINKNKKLLELKEIYNINISNDTLFRHSLLIETPISYIIAIYEATNNLVFECKKANIN